MVRQVCDECRAAVLQLDLVGFTRMSARLPHMRLAQMVKETSLSSSDFKLNSWPYKKWPASPHCHHSYCHPFPTS